MTIEGSGSMQAMASGFTSPVTADPNLSFLAMNGGPTETMVIGMGNTTTETQLDQRGYGRGSPQDAGSYQHGGEAVPVTLGALGNETVTEGGTPISQGFSASGAGNVEVTAVSSNPTFLPDSGIALTCGSLGTSDGVTTEDCTIGLTPASGQVGSASVTVTGVDPYGQTATESFVLTVETPVPTVTVSPTAVTVPEGTVSTRVGVDVTGTDITSVSAESGNPGLLPQSGLSLSTGCGTVTMDCTLTLDPTAGETGTATVGGRRRRTARVRWGWGRWC